MTANLRLVQKDKTAAKPYLLPSKQHSRADEVDYNPNILMELRIPPDIYISNFKYRKYLHIAF